MRYALRLALAVTSLVACTSSSEPEARIPDRIELSGPATPVTAGQAVQMTAQVFDAKNRPIADATVAWESSSPSIAPIDDAGRIATQRPGAATITATSADRSASFALTVVGTPCHQSPTLGAGTTADGAVAGSVAGTDCVFASGLPSKGHAITLASPATLNIEVQGDGLVPVIAVASSAWDLSYNAEAGSVPGDTLRSVRSLPAGSFNIWIAAANHVNASYTLTTSVMNACTMAALTDTLAPGDSLGGAIGPSSCWVNGRVQMQGWRVVTAADEELVIDAFSGAGSPTLYLWPSDNVLAASADGSGSSVATLGFVPTVADTLALWVTLQDNAHAAFSVRRRIPEPPTCLTPTDTIAVGDTIQRLMYYGDCERGATGVRMHSYLLTLDATAPLDIQVATGFFPPGFAVRTLAGDPVHIAQFDDSLGVARVRATLEAGSYLVTVSATTPGATGLYTLSVVADTPP